MSRKNVDHGSLGEASGIGIAASFGALLLGCNPIVAALGGIAFIGGAMLGEAKKLEQESGYNDSENKNK